MAQRIDGCCRHLPGRFSGCYQKRPAALWYCLQGALHRLSGRTAFRLAEMIRSASLRNI